jgi:DNA-binding response OmpR family regulator
MKGPRRPYYESVADNRGPVLLVDDNLDVLVATARYLREQGLEVLTSSSGLGVSTLVRRHSPAVIVLDVTMPALDGDALARLLTSQGLARTTPIIFYSAVGEEELDVIAHRIPGASYVQKLDGAPALYARIHQLETN